MIYHHIPFSIPCFLTLFCPFNRFQVTDDWSPADGSGKSGKSGGGSGKSGKSGGGSGKSGKSGGGSGTSGVSEDGWKEGPKYGRW